MDRRPDLPQVLVNTRDAAAVGLRDGERVRVTNEHGTVEGEASVGDAIAPGAISVPHGFGDPHPGRLASTRVRVDELSGMVTLSGIPVTIERAQAK